MAIPGPHGEVNQDINQRIADFAKLLDSVSSLDDKRVSLWKEIYANALQDRDYAITMYASLSEVVVLDPTSHAIHGPVIAKYIERMSRANDQLLKLADLVSNAVQRDEEASALSTDEIFDRLDGKKTAGGRR